MSEFVAGQRWINDADLSMGLGTVLDVEHRTVSIIFHACGETRTFAKDTAPLTRIRFNVGDSISDLDKRSLKVTAVTEHKQLITYSVINAHGEVEQLEERDLDTAIQLNKPLDRLLSGQVDHNKWFELRHQAMQYQLENYNNPVYGLIGARTSLIPHQLYIANEVASRYSPRVLLADEVGLGKTIEAGLILHHQISKGRAKRVLILVPDPLINQWLVELLRRFNLFFSIFDEERCQAIQDSTDFENPFLAEQTILCSLGLFTDSSERFQQLISADWDLVIIDEAHHLEWSQEKVSEEYQLVEKLAVRTKGLLLLTATPEQFGKESHFARLRLLDPDKFNDFDSFLQQEQQYQHIADLIDNITQDTAFSNDALTYLKSIIPDTKILQNKHDDLSNQEKSELIHQLLDCHGTGRVLFRNTRKTIQGFPERKLIEHPLVYPAEYAEIFQNNTNIDVLLNPEQQPELLDSWTQFDPRINWLANTLIENKPNKFLLITRTAQAANDIAQILKRKFSIPCSVFHEELTIVERDKRAADFADTETGTQVLLCSEIGSEGRNFQFAHHIVLFDLPLNPDLLEQRIGRLDRIGQTQTINIHVPYFIDSPQQQLFEWYHQALNAFAQTCPAAALIYNQTGDELSAFIKSKSFDPNAFQIFIEKCSQLHHILNQQLHDGRDKLLEYSSCRKELAEKLCNQMETFEKNSQLKSFMMDLMDNYGVNIEEHKLQSYILSPAEHMIGQFPGLHDEGMTITFDRSTALHHDDMYFLTWEHPMVKNGIDMLLSSEMGNTSVCSIKNMAFKPGELIVEAIFILGIENGSEKSFEIDLYQQQQLPVKFSFNENMQDISHQLHTLNAKTVDKAIAKQIMQLKEASIKNIIETITEKVSQQASEYLFSHFSTQILILEKEIERLNSLEKINPQVRQDEIDFFRNQRDQLEIALQHPTQQLDSVRLLITT